MDAFHEGETMLYINPETCIDCDACVAECPVEAIYSDMDVPDKWEEYIEINAVKSSELPSIFERKDPLPTAKTLDELLG